VVTRFITNDGTTGGSLDRITRYYVQNGKTVPSAVSGGDTIYASSCSTAANYGGLASMGQALGRGMVLALSIWNDAAGNMNWLDSGAQGPCSASEGNPSNILANNPDTHVVFSNIRWGDIGSTFQLPGNGGSTTTTTTATKTTTTKATTTTNGGSSGATQTPWGQCGGDGYNGAKACPGGYNCEYVNQWYWQCMEYQSLYGRCGGEGWIGSHVCKWPATCQWKNQWYSQCL
jgi:cellulase